MQMNQEFYLDEYHKFHNFMCIHLSDKIVNATLNIYNKVEPILDVNIRKKNYSLTDWMSLNVDGLDYLENLTAKQQPEWVEIDYEAAKAIMAAIKQFEKMKAKAQNKNVFYESFALGHELSGDVEVLNDLESYADIAIMPEMKMAKSVKNIHETPPKKYKEEGASEHSDYADSKNYKYPINNEKHVRAAISYFGKPKNHNEYSKEEREKIARKIIHAANKHGIEVSDEWKNKFIKNNVLKSIIKNATAQGYTKEQIKEVIVDRLNKAIKTKIILRKTFQTDDALNPTRSVPHQEGWDVVGQVKKSVKSEERDFSRDNMKERIIAQ